jgi:zinc transport system substrate-binding protein
LIARELGARVEPAVAVRLQDNAARYAKRLRAMLAATKQRLKPLARPRVVTVHDGYGYLLQELGVGLAGVVEPAHGLLPAAGELQRIVELVKREHIVVVLAEASFPQALQRPLVDVGARVSVISHVATGAFAADTFERGMQANLDTLVEALGAP